MSNVIYDINGQRYTVMENPVIKSVRGPGYNYNFNKLTGLFQRWGNRLEEDPAFSPIGPEIWDCECTTICPGNNNQGAVSPCKFCYKANNLQGSNLCLADFKTMIDKIPRVLTQVAFGTDSRAESNPELFDMMQYCRTLGIIPNITVSDISDTTIKKLCDVCGAVAVSRYENKHTCYKIVQALHAGGITQSNIHCLLSVETFDWCIETAKDAASNIPGLNALVFLSLKKKGRAKSGFHSVSYDQFRMLFLYCLQHKVPVGFDSCSAPRFLRLVNSEHSINDTLRQRYIECCEPCESGIFSFYTGINGCFFPCSFTEGETGWQDGLSLLKCQDFYTDIWYHPRTIAWRKRLISSGETDNCRKCLTFPEIN